MSKLSVPQPSANPNVEVLHLFHPIVLHTKTNRTYTTNVSNASGAANAKTQYQQKKNNTQYQRRNYDHLHIPSIPVNFKLFISHS